MPTPISARTIRIEGEVAIIPLTRGYEAVVDVADLHLVEGRPWYAALDKTGLVYAACKATGPEGAHRTLRMHRVILGVASGVLVDHRDGDGLNNRRGNLRRATQLQNMQNRRPFRHSRTGLKGVSPDGDRWRARITVVGQRIYLGYFPTPEEAHAAYVAAAVRYHGEFART